MPPAELGNMPDLGAMLMRRCLGSLRPSGDACAECRRIPLAGERMHELESGREVCGLCLSESGGRDGEPVRSERVHASDKPLAVVPKAA